MEVVLRAHMWKVGSTWSKSFKCYIFEEFWRNWIVQTQDWDFIYHCSLRRDWCLWTEDSLLKLKIAPEEQCKFYALLAIHLYMWDQVLTLAVLPFGIKGLALEVEHKILCLFIVFILILNEGLWFGHLLSVFDRAEPTWTKMRWYCWCERVAE